MTDPQVTFEFDEHSGLFLPGETIAGQYVVDAPEPGEIKAIEMSVLWHTMGKGEEDMSVHFFERLTAENGAPFDLNRPHRFEAVLPNSPLSYDGILIKVFWSVRVRVFLRGGREVVAEQPFRLGMTPSPRIDPEALNQREEVGPE